MTIHYRSERPKQPPKKKMSIWDRIIVKIALHAILLAVDIRERPFHVFMVALDAIVLAYFLTFKPHLLPALLGITIIIALLMEYGARLWHWWRVK